MKGSVPQSSLFRQLRDLPRPVWILFFGTFVNRFGTFVMPFLALYLTKRGFTSAQAGIAVAAYGVGHLAASMIGGHLADRIGRRNCIAVSMFFSGAMMLALSQAHSYAAIIILTFLAGTGAEMYRPAALALIADLIPEELRSISFAMYRFAVNLGMAAGPATAGFLADRSFFLVFAGDAVTSMAYGVIALAMLPHGLRTYSSEDRVGDATRAAVRDRAFVVFLIATMLMTTADFQCLSTLPLYVRDLGFPNHIFGMLISLNGLLIICFELLLISWVNRYDVRGSIAAGFFFVGIGYAINTVAHGVPLLALSVAVWTAGEMLCAPLSGTYISNIAPEKYRGRYMGLWAMSWAFGMIAGPTAGTLVYERSPLALWLAAGALGVIAGAMMLRQRLTATATSR